jgi:hypothetical protein
MIAILTAAGDQARDVLRATITMPRIGAWQASLTVDGTTAPAGKVTLKAGALTLVGTINRAAVYRGVVRARVVAGGDGLRRVARARHYTGPPARLVLATLCADAGETLSSSSDAGVLASSLLAWTTIAVETGAMVQLVADHLGADVAWRLLPDGTIWVGRESWPDSGLTDYEELEESPEEASVLLGMDVPRLLPGTTVGGRRAEVVDHLITPESYRAKVWLVPG